MTTRIRSTQPSERRDRRGPRRTAFTLIELLVVIAIIAVLAALLMPSLQGARDSAKTARCISNVKQIVLACTLYADDWEQQLPSQRASNNDSRYVWYNLLAPYTSFKNGLIMVNTLTCPSNTKAMFSPYGASDFAIGVLDTSTGIPGSKKLPDIYPGTMLFADDDGCQGSGSCNVVEIFSPAVRPFTQDMDGDGAKDSFSAFHLYNNVMFRHKNRAVAGCADGSVREISVKQWVSNDAHLWGN